nr:helix-hairpin-helix domain-containing protein [Paenibacillus larvae]
MKKTGLPSRFCVEDQFRLVVYYANNPESNKKWWDFTEERKHYRETNGYPSDRPGQEK